MKKIPISPCISESIKYLFDNFRNISLLILQVYIAGIVLSFLVSKLMGIDLARFYSDPFNAESMSSLVYISIFMALLYSFLGTSLTLSLSRHIVFKDAFNTNLLKLIQQKRYLYCFLVTLKALTAVLLTYFLLLLVFAVVLTILLAIFEVFTSSLESLKNGSYDILTISLMGLVYLVCSIIYAFVAAIFIYTPLLTALDKKGSLRESWKLSKGNRLRITTIFLTTYLIPALPVILFICLISYLTMGSLLKHPVWLPFLTSLIHLYLLIPLTASIAFSYRFISTGSEKS